MCWNGRMTFLFWAHVAAAVGGCPILAHFNVDADRGEQVHGHFSFKELRSTDLRSEVIIVAPLPQVFQPIWISCLQASGTCVHAHLTLLEHFLTFLVLFFQQKLYIFGFLYLTLMHYSELIQIWMMTAIWGNEKGNAKLSCCHCHSQWILFLRLFSASCCLQVFKMPFLFFIHWVTNEACSLKAVLTDKTFSSYSNLWSEVRHKRSRGSCCCYTIFGGASSFWYSRRMLDLDS